MRTLLVALILIVMSLVHAPVARAEMSPEQFLKLAEAYQGGYLQLLAASALQVYSTAGLVATEFSTGKRSGPEAADALADTTLLHGVCYATLLEIQKDTPKEDGQATTQIGKLAAVLVQEQSLLLALQDVFSNPSPANVKRVDSARQSVGKLLDKLLAE